MLLPVSGVVYQVLHLLADYVADRQGGLAGGASESVNSVPINEFQVQKSFSWKLAIKAQTRSTHIWRSLQHGEHISVQQSGILANRIDERLAVLLEECAVYDIDRITVRHINQLVLGGWYLGEYNALSFGRRIFGWS